MDGTWIIGAVFIFVSGVLGLINGYVWGFNEGEQAAKDAATLYLTEEDGDLR